MLKKFQNDTRMMMVAGTNYLSENECPEFTYFFHNCALSGDGLRGKELGICMISI